MVHGNIDRRGELVRHAQASRQHTSPDHFRIGAPEHLQKCLSKEYQPLTMRGRSSGSESRDGSSSEEPARSRSLVHQRRCRELW